MGFARRSAVTGAVVTAAFGAAGAAAAPAAPGLITESGPLGPHDPQVRAGEIVYTGDGSGFLAGRGRTAGHAGKIVWSSYGDTSASGTADNWLDNCEPSCAGGRFTGYPVTLSASRPKVVGGHDIFTKMVVVYTSRRPSFEKHSRQTWTVSYQDHAYFWNFPS